MNVSVKKKVGEILGIPIITGDINLKTENEIHVSQLLYMNDPDNPPIHDVYEFATETDINKVADNILKL